MIYIGIHRTNNLDDDYMGSGVYIGRAICKYGKSSFSKEILEFFSTEEQMWKREQEIVTTEFVARSDTYNLTEGGKYLGPDAQSKGREKSLITQYNNNLGIWSKESRLKVYEYNSSKRGKDNFKKARNKGCKLALSKESKEKRLATLSKINHQKGATNSQHGTIWITDGIQNLKIKVDELIPEGFVKGRKIVNEKVYDKRISDNRLKKEKEILKRIDTLKDIDFSSGGWTDRVGALWGVSRPAAWNWMKKYCPELMPN